MVYVCHLEKVHLKPLIFQMYTFPSEVLFTINLVIDLWKWKVMITNLAKELELCKQTFFMMLKLHNNINICTFVFMDVYQKILFALGKSIMVALNC